jgi:hypothetical protein
MQGHSQSNIIIRCSGSSVKLEFIGINMLHFQSLALVHCYVKVEGTNASRVSISRVNFTVFNTLALNIRSSDYVSISRSALQGRVRAGQSMVNISNVNYLDLGLCNFANITPTSHSPVLIFNHVHVIQIFW